MKRRAILFSVPTNGASYRVRADIALMVDGKEGLHSFLLQTFDKTPFPAGGPAWHLCETIAFVNKMIDAGMPWSAMATCRRSNGLMGALIEAAANRLDEFQGAT